MTIEYKGKQIEAYSLPLMKKFAQEILHGEKTIEIRTMSERNYAMFMDKDKIAANEKLIDEGRGEECVLAMKEVFAIHFYDRGGHFEINVLVDELGVGQMTKKWVKEMNEKFNFHDYDNGWQKYDGLPDDKIPMFFWFHIEEVLSHKGLD